MEGCVDLRISMYIPWPQNLKTKATPEGVGSIQHHCGLQGSSDSRGLTPRELKTPVPDTLEGPLGFSWEKSLVHPSGIAHVPHSR